MDDTILIGEDSRKNIWTIKALLRGFELVLGLQVNLQAAASFKSFGFVCFTLCFLVSQ